MTSRAVAFICVAVVAGCGSQAASSSHIPSLALPDASEALPDAFETAASWEPMAESMWPRGYDQAASHESPEAFAVSMISAIEGSWANAAPVPVVEVERIDIEASQALVIVTEAGGAEGLPPGTQFAFELVEIGTDWSISRAWRRSICWPPEVDLVCE